MKKTKTRKHRRFRNFIAKTLNEMRFGLFRPQVIKNKKKQLRADRRTERKEIREALDFE